MRYGEIFYKEGLIDTLHTMYTRGEIEEKEFRTWFKLNNKTLISILTLVGETDTDTME